MRTAGPQAARTAATSSHSTRSPPSTTERTLSSRSPGSSARTTWRSRVGDPRSTVRRLSSAASTMARAPRRVGDRISPDAPVSTTVSRLRIPAMVAAE